MANNGPIVVTTGVAPLGSSAGSQLTFTTKYPFAKLDTTNLKSFQVVSILLTKDVTSPGSVNSSASTQIAFFPHGYTYIPSTWALVSTDGFQTVSGQEESFVYGSNSGVGVSSANLYITADATNIYFTISKFWGGADPQPPNLTGLFLTIRLYVFVEDLTGTSVPASA